jgi:hypothetical protein
MICIRSDGPGVVLEVRGDLDDAAGELLTEVVRAALVSVRRAHRIHLDLSAVSSPLTRLPRIARQLERAGALVTVPATFRGSDAVGTPHRSAGVTS